MNKKTIIKIFILVFIIGFLFLIYFVFAQLSPEEIIKNQDLIELKTRDAYKILNNLRQEFSEEWEKLTSSSEYFDIKEQAILVTLREAFEANSMQYIFTYIIVYQPINFEQGKVAIGIYSSEIIKTPEVSLKYPWEGGINELPPFIIEITGEVENNDIGWGSAYRWIKGPEINIIFDQPVPKFEFKEPTILERIEAYFNKAKVVLSKIKEFGQGIIDSIFSFISGSDSFEASVSPDIEYLGQQNEEPGSAPAAAAAGGGGGKKGGT